MALLKLEDIKKLLDDNKIDLKDLEKLSALEEISKVAQIAIVSSANSEAVNSEWKRHELMPFVSEFFGQERGSKAAAIKEIKSLGFEKEKILMVGDAPGDLDAAKVNEVHFYPILFGKENIFAGA